MIDASEPGRGQLNHPKTTVGAEVGIQPETHGFVEALCAVDVCNGQHDHFEFHVHFQDSFDTFEFSVREVQRNLQCRHGGGQRIVLPCERAEFDELRLG